MCLTRHLHTALFLFTQLAPLQCFFSFYTHSICILYCAYTAFFLSTHPASVHCCSSCHTAGIPVLWANSGSFWFKSSTLRACFCYLILRLLCLLTSLCYNEFWPFWFTFWPFRFRFWSLWFSFWPFRFRFWPFRFSFWSFRFTFWSLFWFRFSTLSVLLFLVWYWDHPVFLQHFHRSWTHAHIHLMLVGTKHELAHLTPYIFLCMPFYFLFWMRMYPQEYVYNNQDARTHIHTHTHTHTQTTLTCRTFNTRLACVTLRTNRTCTHANTCVNARNHPLPSTNV
jgi:hypothetical protein